MEVADPGVWQIQKQVRSNLWNKIWNQIKYLKVLFNESIIEFFIGTTECLCSECVFITEHQN